MNLFDHRHCWSGLFAKPFPAWQDGLRAVSDSIGGFDFHSTWSGYHGWREVADAALEFRPTALLLMGHSNGVYAITRIAERLNEAGLPCWLIAWDCTLKDCPSIGANVPEALELWAGLARLEKGEDFKGQLHRLDYPEETHISILNNEHAQAAAIAFGRRFAAAYPQSESVVV